MLLDERDFGLHGERDVAQAGGGAAIGRHAGENPGAALLKHQSAGAVDRVDQQAPTAIVLDGSPRQHQRVSREPLADEIQRLLARQLCESLDEGILTHAVDGVDRVAGVASHRRELLRRLAGARIDHGCADPLVDREERLEEALGGVHVRCPACSARSGPPAARPPSPPGPCRSGNSRLRSLDRRGT